MPAYLLNLLEQMILQSFVSCCSAQSLLQERDVHPEQFFALDIWVFWVAGSPEVLAFLDLGVFPEFPSRTTFSIIPYDTIWEQDNLLAVIMVSINEVVILSVMEKGGVEANHGFEEAI